MSPEPATTIQVQTDSDVATMRLAAALARRLRPGDLVALNGALGSGKTCFVRGLASGLGIDVAQVSSPTFVIRQEYESADGASTLTHIDAYRLGDPSELETIGWSELLEGAQSIVAVEWADRIREALPAERIEVAFAHLDLNTRDLTISASPGLADRVAPLGDPAPNRCRTCGRPIDAGSADAPFCSQRCRMADLGHWLSGGHRISREIEEDDLMP